MVGHSDVSGQQAFDQQQPQVCDLVKVVGPNGPWPARVAPHIDEDLSPRDHESVGTEILCQVWITIQE